MAQVDAVVKGAGVMAIGAADTSGMAGLSVYTRVAAELKTRLMPVTACVVARDSRQQVQALHAVPPTIVARQIDVVARSFRPSACVIGMLWRHQTVDVVVDRIRRRELKQIVFCPVVGQNEGRALSTARAVKQSVRYLAPLCQLVICSLESANILTQVNVTGLESARKSAGALLDRGTAWVLVRNVPVRGEVRNLLFGPETSEFYTGQSSAGDDDALCAAIACYLESEKSMQEAVAHAHEYLQCAG